MLLSRTSQYAIQTLVYIAAQDYTPVLSREAAERLQVPAPYLAKIMQALCKGGLVNSFRGRLGGFSLGAKPEDISLMQILQITEGPGFSKDCLLGLKVCSDETACPVHHQWKPIKLEIIDLLNKQTLAILSEAVRSGKYRISDLPQALLPDSAKIS